MNRLNIFVRSLEESFERTKLVFNSQTVRETRFTFETYDQMRRVLTPKRERLLYEMAGCGPISTPQLARLLRRPHSDVEADLCVLQSVGILNKAEDGKPVLPYDVVRILY